MSHGTSEYTPLGDRRSWSSSSSRCSRCFWIVMLSLQDAGDDRRRAPDPEGVDAGELQGAVRGRLGQPAAAPADQLDRDRADRDDDRGDAGVVRGLRDRAPGLPGQGLMLGGALAIAMFPPISVVGPLFDMWRALGLYRHVPGPDHPVPDVRAAAGDLHPGRRSSERYRGISKQAAQVDGATPFQAFTKVIFPLAAPGVFTAAILVFIFAWNDFVFADLADVVQRVAHGARRRSRSSPASRSSPQPTGNIAAAAVLVTVPIIIFVLSSSAASSRA